MTTTRRHAIQMAIGASLGPLFPSLASGSGTSEQDLRMANHLAGSLGPMADARTHVLALGTLLESGVPVEEATDRTLAFSALLRQQRERSAEVVSEGRAAQARATAKGVLELLRGGGPVGAAAKVAILNATELNAVEDLQLAAFQAVAEMTPLDGGGITLSELAFSPGLVPSRMSLDRAMLAIWRKYSASKEEDREVLLRELARVGVAVPDSAPEPRRAPQSVDEVAATISGIASKETPGEWFRQNSKELAGGLALGSSLLALSSPREGAMLGQVSDLALGFVSLALSTPAPSPFLFAVGGAQTLIGLGSALGLVGRGTPPPDPVLQFLQQFSTAVLDELAAIREDLAEVRADLRRLESLIQQGFSHIDDRLQQVLNDLGDLTAWVYWAKKADRRFRLNRYVYIECAQPARANQTTLNRCGKEIAAFDTFARDMSQYHPTAVGTWGRRAGADWKPPSEDRSVGPWAELVCAAGRLRAVSANGGRQATRAMGTELPPHLPTVTELGRLALAMSREDSTALALRKCAASASTTLDFLESIEPEDFTGSIDRLRQLWSDPAIDDLLGASLRDILPEFARPNPMLPGFKAHFASSIRAGGNGCRYGGKHCPGDWGTPLGTDSVAPAPGSDYRHLPAEWDGRRTKREGLGLRGRGSIRIPLQLDSVSSWLPAMKAFGGYAPATSNPIGEYTFDNYVLRNASLAWDEPVHRAGPISWVNVRANGKSYSLNTTDPAGKGYRGTRLFPYHMGTKTIASPAEWEEIASEGRRLLLSIAEDVVRRVAERAAERYATDDFVGCESAKEFKTRVRNLVRPMTAVYRGVLGTDGSTPLATWVDGAHRPVTRALARLTPRESASLADEGPLSNWNADLDEVHNLLLKDPGWNESLPDRGAIPGLRRLIAACEVSAPT